MRGRRWLLVVFGWVCALGALAPVAASAAVASVTVNFANQADSALTLTSFTLSSGCVQNPPPANIGLGKGAVISTQACGFLGLGTEFTASYQLDAYPSKSVQLHFAANTLGGGTATAQAPDGYQAVLSGTGTNVPNESFNVGFGCNSTGCDGIPDDWKRNGVTIDPGGGDPKQFVDLPRMGVSLDRPNVFVQMDWMQDATHNTQLRQASIDAVIKAFDQDPVTYYNSRRAGITLIVDAGPNSTITPGGAKWGSLSHAGAIPWSKDIAIQDTQGNLHIDNYDALWDTQFRPTGRVPIFHYAIAASELDPGDGSSGLGGTWGEIISLADFNNGTGGTQDDETGSFMHELGHTLGLQHGGQDAVNWKPNYPSVMNYIWQLKGVYRNGQFVFDYSRDTTPDVDETKLTETGGINLGANPSESGAGYSCQNGTDSSGNPTYAFYRSPTLKPLDFNCDGTPGNGGTGFDINQDGQQTVLKGSTSDWSRINFKASGVGAGAGAKDTVTAPDTVPYHQDITPQIAASIRTLPLDSKLTYTGATSGDSDDPATVSAKLVDPGNANSPVIGAAVSFQFGSATGERCTAMTDALGDASCVITPYDLPGAYTLTASFAGNADFKPASDTATFTVIQEELKLTYTGPSSSDYHDAFTASAVLVDPADNTPVAGKTVTFSLGTADQCTAPTDGTGAASCSLTPHQPGIQQLSAVFAGDANHLAAQSSQTVTVTPEETTLAGTGPALILAGSGGVTLSANLLEDGATAPVPAETVAFVIGLQTCSGTTDATGHAQCTIPSVLAGLGPESVTDSFAGDSYYAASSDSRTATVFAFPAGGAFAIGDGSAAKANSVVTWWSYTWSAANRTSRRVAPSAFKGFVNTVTLPDTSPATSCGQPWSTDPGNSPPPPNAIPSYMGVLVTSAVSKQSPTKITGNVTQIDVVKVAPGYAPSPGHPGTGTIVGRFC